MLNMKTQFITILACALTLCTVVHAQPQSRGWGHPSGVQKTSDLVYAEVGKLKLKLDLYRPEKITAEKGLPVVVWIHGGGWSMGNKQRCPLVHLTGHGYAVASVQYRLSGEATWPAQIADCRAAIRWLRAYAKRYQLDPRRIGVAGASAGGHLVAMLGTGGDVPGLDPKNAPHADQSSAVQAVVDFFGPTDLVNYPGHDPEAKHTVIAKLLGGSVHEKIELARQASPVNHVGAGDAPFLIIQGDRDRLVPLSQSRKLHEALVKAKVSSQLHVVEGGGHGMGLMRQEPDLKDRLIKFFDAHLK